MKIANPIYDSAFKYLMKDEKIARYFLSTLLGREIQVEGFLQTEDSQVLKHAESGFMLQRMDFQETIIDENGNPRKVSIELQKSLIPGDLTRFRKYLASCYHDVSLHKKDKNQQELIFIYIAGFNLNIPVAAVRTSTQLIDVSTGQLIDASTDDDPFMRLLHHESIFVGVQKLSKRMQTRSDRLLSIFNQEYMQKDDTKIIELPEESITGLTADGSLHVAKRLNGALLDHEVHQQMLEQEQFQESIDELIAKSENDRELNIGIGKELGKIEGKIEVAKSLKVLNIDISTIQAATGLSPEEIEKI